MARHDYVKRCEVLDYIDSHPQATIKQTAEACKVAQGFVADMRDQLSVGAMLSARQKMEAHIRKLEGLINPAIGVLSGALDLEANVTREAITAAKDVLDRVGPIRAEKSVLSNPDGSNVFTDPGRDRLPDAVLDRLIALAGQPGVPESPEGTETPE